MFDFAKSIAELRLSEAEFALLSAIVLMQPDRDYLREVNHVEKLNMFLNKTLQAELSRSQNSDPFDTNGLNIYDLLIAKIPVLRHLSALHMEALSNFKATSPDIEFPALHRELFVKVPLVEQDANGQMQQ